MAAQFVSTPENLEIVEAIVDSLRRLKADAILPNKAIDNLARGKRHLVMKARKLVQEQEGCVFATVIGVGIKRLPNGESHLVGQAARMKALRGTKRAQSQIVAVIRKGSATMDRQTRQRCLNEVNKLGLIAEFCRDDE